MEFHTSPKTIKDILLSGKRFLIPRYQRQFSWTPTNELKDFLNDIRGRLRLTKENTLVPDEYFFGTVIFQGDLISAGKEWKDVYIIDGQQRFTAITIFLRVLFDKFTEIGENDLASLVWKYIMARDDDGKEFAVFTNETPCPFFQFKIQRLGRSIDPSTAEEDLILAAYRYLDKELSEKALARYFSDNYPTITFNYLDCLKLIRDQLLGSRVIAIWTTEASYANSIFEAVNAKGLELTALDLIKNSIFTLCGSNPSTLAIAQESWKDIGESLNKDGARIPPDIFFLHFWSAKYGKKGRRGLYRDFVQKIKSEEACEKLLTEMSEYADYYFDIIKPDISQFGGNPKYLPLVQTLNVLSNSFSLEMPRPFLMVTFKKWKEGTITTKQYLGLLRFLTYFHFVYSCVCALRSNKIEPFYLSATNKLFSNSDSTSCFNLIKKFERDLLSLVPPKEQFIGNLSKCSYSNVSDDFNETACGFFLREEQRVFSKVEFFDNQAFSIEHVFGDNAAEPWTQALPYLLPLETNVNNGIPGPVKGIDKIEFYKKSKYPFVIKFAEEAEPLKTNKELRDLMEKNFLKFSSFLYNSLKSMAN